MKFHCLFRTASCRAGRVFSSLDSGGVTVRRVLLSLAVITLCAGWAMASEDTPLKLVTSVDLPKYSGDFDHFAADVSGNRLFLAAEDHGTLEVFDLKSSKWLKTVKGFDTPHSIFPVPAVHRVLV